MAELALKLHTVHGNREDGDTICAFNDQRIQCCHAQMICHVKNLGNAARRPKDSLPDVFNRTVRQYLFTRISHTEIVRKNLWTGEEETFGAPDIDVPLFVKRRLNHARHAVFGDPGSEWWYGGNTRETESRAAKIWDEIEKVTPHKRTDDERTKWPVGSQDVKSYLFLSTYNFTTQMANAIVQPLQLDENRMVAKSSTRVNWRDHSTLSKQVEATIVDRTQSADVRNFETHVLEDIIEFKGLKNG